MNELLIRVGLLSREKMCVNVVCGEHANKSIRHSIYTAPVIECFVLRRYSFVIVSMENSGGKEDLRFVKGVEEGADVDFAACLS